MTITAPNHHHQLAYVMRWLLVGIVAGSVASIGLYNETVTLRRIASERAKAVESLKTENARLKNAFYAAADTDRLIAAAQRLGYVRDSNPSYVAFRVDGTPVQAAAVSLQR